MKYDLSKIMKRAWEIKREADRKTQNALYNVNIFRDLFTCEKAPFSICLKMAWEEAKKVPEMAKSLDITEIAASKIIEKETALLSEYRSSVSWKIWRGYGKARAYYRISGMSNYWNSKTTHFIDIA